mmetsp:Transcript_63736/g.207028  ORF Transcript_63736/g.207028 Transcript_63736/m.207028 type:complete len:214 (-) Transcript_63736:23-664(-)
MVSKSWCTELTSNKSAQGVTCMMCMCWDAPPKLYLRGPRLPKRAGSSSNIRSATTTAADLSRWINSCGMAPRTATKPTKENACAASRCQPTVPAAGKSCWAEPRPELQPWTAVRHGTSSKEGSADAGASKAPSAKCRHKRSPLTTKGCELMRVCKATSCFKKQRPLKSPSSGTSTRKAQIAQRSCAWQKCRQCTADSAVCTARSWPGASLPHW